MLVHLMTTKYGYVPIVWGSIVIIACWFIASRAKRRRYLKNLRKNASLIEGFGWCSIHGRVSAGHRCDATKGEEWKDTR